VQQRQFVADVAADQQHRRGLSISADGISNASATAPSLKSSCCRRWSMLPVPMRGGDRGEQRALLVRASPDWRARRCPAGAAQQRGGQRQRLFPSASRKPSPSRTSGRDARSAAYRPSCE
jgi:hypothetical protein